MEYKLIYKLDKNPKQQLLLDCSFRQHTIDTMKHQMSQGNAANLAEQITSGQSLFNLPAGRQPTLAECEAVIRRLQQINEQQQHEVK